MNNMKYTLLNNVGYHMWMGNTDLVMHYVNCHTMQYGEMKMDDWATATAVNELLWLITWKHGMANRAVPTAPSLNSRVPPILSPRIPSPTMATVSFIGRAADIFTPILTYGWDFDITEDSNGDGDPANDWVPQGVYDWDTYQSADRWYEVFYDPGSDPAWAMTVTQVDGNQGRAEVESHAVASVDGPNLTLEIPSAELPRGAASLYRTVSFAHDGASSESDRGADVCGDNPTQPMKSFVEVDWSAAQ